MAHVFIKLNKEEKRLFNKYCSKNGMKLSSAMKNALLEKIEDEYDLALYESAMAEYEKNPVTYSLEEVRKEFGIKQ